MLPHSSPTVTHFTVLCLSPSVPHTHLRWTALYDNTWHLINDNYWIPKPTHHCTFSVPTTPSNFENTQQLSCFQRLVWISASATYGVRSLRYLAHRERLIMVFSKNTRSYGSITEFGWHGHLFMAFLDDAYLHV